MSFIGLLATYRIAALLGKPCLISDQAIVVAKYAFILEDAVDLRQV